MGCAWGSAVPRVGSGLQQALAAELAASPRAAGPGPRLSLPAGAGEAARAAVGVGEWPLDGRWRLGGLHAGKGGGNRVRFLPQRHGGTPAVRSGWGLWGAAPYSGPRLGSVRWGWQGRARDGAPEPLSCAGSLTDGGARCCYRGGASWVPRSTEERSEARGCVRAEPAGVLGAEGSGGAGVGGRDGLGREVARPPGLCSRKPGPESAQGLGWGGAQGNWAGDPTPPPPGARRLRDPWSLPGGPWPNWGLCESSGDVTLEGFLWLLC